MILKQIIVGQLRNFTYIVGDENTRRGVIIDPSWDLDKVIKAARQEKLEILFGLNTHSHWDHTAGNKELSQRTGAKIVAHEKAPTQKDMAIKDGDILEIGDIRMQVMHTPGHCPDSVCFRIESSANTPHIIFTGDTLFIGNCGRTDLPGGSSEDLYDSFYQKILKLDDMVKIYPGHDYGSRLCSSLRYEMKHNHALQPRSKKEFVRIMSEPSLSG